MPGAALAESYVDELLALGRASGLDAVGVAPAAPMTRARRVIEQRKAAGLHGGMQFTYRNPARSTEPSQSVPGARAMVVGARAYRRDEPDPPAGTAAGRVARYAWADFYAPLRAGLGAVAQRLRDDGWSARVFADDNAIVDREAAHQAGIGWFGKNANLLLPGRGSWFVLGSVVTTAPLPAAPRTAPDGCGSCTACVEGCPTGAIVASGVVDARRCLAWLLQQEGSFPRQFRAALGDRLYGCDDCQEVCPPNRRLAHRATGAPPPSDAELEAWVPIIELLDESDEILLARHGRWYIPRREPRWLRRNALVVLGNIGDGRSSGVGAVLARYLADPDPMLRAHAVWAARRLGRADLLALVADDPDAGVREELSAGA